MAINFTRTVPVLRMFDVRKAKQFYRDFLGFSIDWEHRFEPNTPLYMQISRGSFVIHLSEHHGDGVPGTAVFVEMKGIEEFLHELRKKRYKYYRPGIQLQPWNAKELGVTDPFGNRIRFTEFLESENKKRRRA